MSLAVWQFGRRHAPATFSMWNLRAFVVAFVPQCQPRGLALYGPVDRFPRNRFIPNFSLRKRKHQSVIHHTLTSMVASLKAWAGGVHHPWLLPRPRGPCRSPRGGRLSSNQGRQIPVIIAGMAEPDCQIALGRRMLRAVPNAQRIAVKMPGRLPASL